MKNLLLLFLIFISTFSFSQGTLQFNQVKLVSAQETVPIGKVWKVESIIIPKKSAVVFKQQVGGSCGCNSSSNYSRDEYQSVLFPESSNFNSVNKNNVIINNSEYNLSEGHNPIWLPAGTVVSTRNIISSPQQAHAGGSSCHAPYWIDGVYMGCSAYTPPIVTVVPVLSVIEFNVIP